jgi:type II secretory pathway pseudopilin PulG
MRRHRGSALIAALIVIAVLALVTVATLRLADISKGQSAKDARKFGQAACIDAARQYLISRLRLYGVPTQVSFDEVVSTEAGPRHIYTGHVRQPDASGQVSGPVPVSINGLTPLRTGFVGGGTARSREISNTIGAPSIGGKPYQVVVSCSDPLAGDMELEFTLKFGL